MDKINSIQKVYMKKSKRIFAFLFALVMLMQTTFVSFGSFAEETPKKFKAYANSRTPEFIEIGEIDGGQVKNRMVAYCLNYNFAYPKVKELKDKSAEYTKLDSKDLKDLETTKKDDDLYENLRRVLYNGYPTDGAHFVEFEKISENRMRFLTQYAIWHYTDGKNAEDFNLSGSEKEIFESLINPDSENLRKVPDSFNPTLFKNDKSIKADNSANAHKPYFQNLIGSPKSDDKTYDIYAQKVWEGMKGSDKPVVEFELREKNGDKKVDIANNPVEMTVSKDKEMSDVVVWKDLKKSPTEYKVVEKYKSDEDSKKYISSSLTGNGRKESPYTITNGKLNSSFILQIKINKYWENVDGVEKPEVYLGLFRKTATKPEELVTKAMLNYGMGQENHPNFENPIKVDSSQSIFTKDLTRLNLLGKVDGSDENSESYIYFMKELKKVGEEFKDFDAQGFTSKLETNNSKETNPTFTFTNTYTGKFKINISKKKITGEDELPGADLRVLKSTGENVTSWTSSNKPKKIELTEGDYKLVEDTAPAGYEKVSVFEFSVNKKGEVTLKNNVEGVNVDNSKSTLIVRDKDEKVSKNIKISKISNDQTPLKDVEIKITKINDKTNLDTDISLNPDKDIVAKFITTGTDEEISLKPGSYKLEEISTPETHEKLEKVIYFDVDENGTITFKAGEDYNNIAVADKDKLTVINKKKPEELKEISISKQNLAGEEIEGAKIQIKTPDGQVVKGKLGEESDKDLSWTSGKTSQKISLKAGTYIFHEEAAPNGYKTVTDIKFTVGNDGKISDLKFFENGKEKEVPTENESKVEGETKLVVKDKIEEKTVINTTIGFGGNFAKDGQELNLTKDKAGTDKTVEDKITYKNLPSGQKYTFKAELYELPLDAKEWKSVGSTNVTVDVPESGSGETKVEFKNIKLNVGSKYTVVVKAESNNNLLEKEGKLEKHIIIHNEGKNDKTETIIVEKNVPQTQELKEISISKQNLAGEEIEGAKIQIKTLDGQVAKGKLGKESDKDLSWTSGKTSQKISLKAGTYIFHEEAAPNGYKTVTDIKFTVDNDGKISDLKFFENGKEKEVPTENESKVEGETKLVVKDKIEEKAVINTSIGFDGKFAQAGQELNLTKDKAGTDKTVEDKITYKNLPSGQKYTFKAELYELPLDAKEWKSVGSTNVTVDVPESGSGETKVEFKKVTLNVGSKYTVVVKAESNNNLLEKEGKLEKHIIIHNEGKNDKTETIIVEKNVPQPQEPKKKDIVVSKVQLGDDNNEVKEVVGAKIQIFEGENTSGNKVDEWITESGKGHKVTGLEVGKKYTLHEEVAPKGLKVVTDFVFTVDENGNVKVETTLTSGKAEFKDGKLIVTDDKEVVQPQEPKKKDIVVSKVQLGDDNNVVKEVVGAKIQIFEGENTSGNKVDEWTTESGKNHEVKGLEVGKKYTLHEEVAPKGLKVVTDFVFTVDENGNVKVETTLTSGKAEFKDGKLIVTDDKEVVQPQEPKPEEPKPENPSLKPEPKDNQEPKMKKTSIGLSSSISMVLVGMAGLVISSKKRNK